MEWNSTNITKKLITINDSYIQSLKQQWFENSHNIVNYFNFIPIANEWFKSTKLNSLHGWNEFSCIDVSVGCTHFIESLIIKYGWDGIQVLPDEYAYYTLMGKYGTELGNLEPNIPLIISLPNWRYSDLRPDWNDILKECEQKNIDIHIDFAWLTVARGIEIDLSHPNIKSFVMSMSKYSLEWNRIGLRWSKQRTVDSITILNRFHGDINSSLTSCGAFIIKNLPRDYGWEKYYDAHHNICKTLDLIPTKIVHVGQFKDGSGPAGIGNMLSFRPDSI